METNHQDTKPDTHVLITRAQWASVLQRLTDLESAVGGVEVYQEELGSRVAELEGEEVTQPGIGDLDLSGHQIP